MSHRSIIHWNQWLSQKLGRLVIQAERAILGSLLTGTYGKHAILIGVPAQEELLKLFDFPCRSLLAPSYSQLQELRVIESSFHELPIASGSIDLVVLPHALELVDNPRQLLAEACRIVKPEGHLIICGFNPFSLWGLKKIFRQQESIFSALHFLKMRLVKEWLNLSDFELVKETTTFYRPPLQNQQILKKLQFLEQLGSQCHLPVGGVYILMAKAKVIPLTPIRLRWKQTLAKVAVPTTIPGPTARNSK